MTTETQRMYQEKKSSMDRLSDLETQFKALQEGLPKLIRSIGEQINRTNEQTSTALTQYDAVVSAIVAIVGPDLVTAKLNEQTLAREVANAEATKARNAKLVEEGILEPVESVDTTSVVVVSESKPDGSPQGAGWFTVPVDNQTEELKAAFVGKLVGQEFTAPNGNKVKILEIYKFNADKVKTQEQ